MGSYRASMAYRNTEEEGVFGTLTVFLLRWAILAAAVWAAASFVPGIHVDGWVSALAAALVLGLVNAFLRPIAIVVTFPLIVVTAGLFILILNALLFLFASWIAGRLDGITFEVDGFWPALGGSLLVSIVSWALAAFVGVRR